MPKPLGIFLPHLPNIATHLFIVVHRPNAHVWGAVVAEEPSGSAKYLLRFVGGGGRGGVQAATDLAQRHGNIEDLIVPPALPARCFQGCDV